jgi:glycosyltransferase involved in cell wall biosynthesis
MRGWLAGNIRHFDVSHIHLARDLVTAPAAVRIRNARLPFVVQTHGMVIRSSHPLAGSFDRIWTTRILRSAADVLYLTAHERSQLELIGGSSINLTHLPNGIPDISVNGMAPRRGGDELPEVLFFARLHPRKRPSLFAEAAVLLLRSGVQASFVVAGPPEGAEALVDSVIEAARLDGFGESVLRREVGVPLDGAYSRLSAASIYVLPSLMEPFGMTIVEALAVGVPVVVSNDGGLASFVRRHRCGLTVDATIDDLVDAISELLGDLPQASEMGRRGQQGVRDEFNISEIGKSLDRIYQRALEKRRDQA